jgi:hypothetical protein
MTERVCLRCDWTGSTRSRACPSCEAPLFREATSSGPRRRFERRRRQPPGEPSPGAAEPPVSPRRRDALGIVALLVALAVAVAVIQRGSPSEAPSQPAASGVAGLQGVLLYTAPDQISDRLWIWNLETDAVARGPRVQAPLELIDAYRYPGTVGVVSSSPVGGEKASSVRFFGENDKPTPLVEGDAVAWAPGGRVVQAVARSSACGPIALRTYLLGGDGINEGSTRTDVCGEIRDLWRDEHTAHIRVGTSRKETIVRLELAGGTLSPVLSGQAWRFATTAGQALLLAGTCGQERCLVPFPDDRWYEADGYPLRPESFLATSRDATTAYVLGTADGVRGVYAIEVDSRLDPGQVTLVLPTEGADVRATPTHLDGLLIARDGAVVLVRPDGTAEALHVPEGSPPPAGPILWVAGLPYSEP